MKNNYLNWILATAAGAIVGSIAVEFYRKQKARMADEKAASAKPKEILILEKL